METLEASLVAWIFVLKTNLSFGVVLKQHRLQTRRNIQLTKFVAEWLVIMVCYRWGLMFWFWFDTWEGTTFGPTDKPTGHKWDTSTALNLSNVTSTLSPYHSKTSSWSHPPVHHQCHQQHQDWRSRPFKLHLPAALITHCLQSAVSWKVALKKRWKLCSEISIIKYQLLRG